MVRIVIPFCAGIMLAIYYGLIINNALFWVSSLLLFSSLLILNGYFKPGYSYRYLFGLVVCILLIMCGIKITEANHQLKDKYHFSHYGDIQGYAAIKLTEAVSEKANSFQVNGKVICILGSDTAIGVNGKIILYLEKNDKASVLNYGDIIITENRFQPTRPPSNPNEFNFRQFLERNNVFHQSYRRADEWHATGINKGNIILNKVHEIRNTALLILERNNVTGREFAVASALVLGFRDNLDRELQKGFAGAGAMHVLCVSGLHVGIIFLVLKFILGFLPGFKGSRWLHLFLIIFFIWLYAAITGFSPSVQRASTMFTFVAIGSSLNRKTNIYNTLAASALFLMIADPFIITKIGFQLSYIAVIGIVSMQPYFYKTMLFKNIILDKAWAIITVSIAAQLATGPLGLFYFNQFPNYFILTNLIVIPLASLIIYSALSVILLSPITVISNLLGVFLSKLIMIMHRSVCWIEALPGSVSTNIYISLPETLLIFTIIILFTNMLFLANKMLLKPTLIALLLLICSVNIREYKNTKNEYFVVYDISNSIAIDFFSGKSNIFISCSTLLEDTQKQEFHIIDNRIINGISNADLEICVDNPEDQLGPNFLFIKNFMVFHEKTLFFLTPEVGEINSDADFNVDYVVVSKNPGANPEQIIKNLNPKKVIVDSSNNWYNSRSWERICNKHGVSFWDVRQKGAYISCSAL